MSVISLMAAVLDEELQGRGISSLTRLDCEAVVRRMIERTAELETVFEARRKEPSPEPGQD